MTSSRPRGVISRLSSRGGTEITNVTLGRPTCKVRTILAQPSRMNDPWTRFNTVALACLIAFTSACQERGSGAGGGMWGASQPQPNAALQSLVTGNTLGTLVAGPQTPAAERTRLIDQLRRVYKDQNYQLIWIDGDRPSNRYREFVKAL